MGGIQLIPVFFVVLLVTSAHAFGPRVRFSAKHRSTLAAELGQISSLANETTEAFFHDQRFDHFTPEDNRTFSQKYFEYLEYFEPHNGPIFLAMCGEETCYSGYGSKFYVSDLSQEFGGAVVTLEHRYYGPSSPFQNFTTENMKYLTVEQSLADHALFIDYYQDLINSKFNKTGKNPWIVVGGSYSGALSAWFRLKYPHLVIGSWASSAVVDPIVDYQEYDEQIGISVGPKCARALRVITRAVERHLKTDPEGIKKAFGASMLKNDVDFLSYIADVAATPVQYSFPGSLCDPLVQIGKNTTALLNFYALYAGLTSDPTLYDTDEFLRLVKENDQDAKDLYSWTYQVCTQFGFFQTHSKKGGVRSSRINLQYFLDVCNETFGIPMYPEAGRVNLDFGAQNIAGSKIIFLNGSQDPWKHASKLTSSTEEPAMIMKCYKCGHCNDLFHVPEKCSDSKLCFEVSKAHTLVHHHVKSWLSN